MLFNKLLTKRQDHDFTNHPCANSNTHGHMIHWEPNTVAVMSSYKAYLFE